MKPDILANPSQQAFSHTEWPGHAGMTSTSSSIHAMAAPPDAVTISAPAPTRPHAMHGAGPRPAPEPRPHGYSNGHATMSSSWSSAAAIAPALGEAARGTPADIELHQGKGVYLRAGKRLFDIFGAAFALMCASPLLFVMAVLIKLESRGPIFYRSERLGRGGRPFTFLKLRSMVDGAHQRRHDVAHLNECDGPVFKISNDPRVTRIGRFMRRTSIDEIPQFLNVLRGDMSLVGPRPPIPEEVAHYEPWQMKRLSVRPGITCLWQISGRSRIGFDEWMRLDLEYIRHQSPAMDIRILLRTVPAVLSRDGAY